MPTGRFRRGPRWSASSRRAYARAMEPDTSTATLDAADERTLQAFVREYKQGPQTPEPGASCTGGTVTDLVGRS